MSWYILCLPRPPRMDADPERPNQLATLCCLAQSALLCNQMPTSQAVSRTCQALARAWRKGSRRMPWPTVAEHVRLLPPLRRSLRLGGLVDAVAQVPLPAADSAGRSLHSFRDHEALVRQLFKGPAPAALIWECEPNVLLLHVRDGVWGVRAKRGARAVAAARLPSVCKALQFISPPPASLSYACARLELV